MPDYLYIHIPFCLRKCHYCDFLSIPYDRDLAEDYIEAACRELDTRGDRIGVLKTVYIGGGTPSMLEIPLLKRLFSHLRQNFSLQEDTEITLEANPGTVTAPKLREIRGIEINRLSLGVQSFDDSELKTLGRVHSSADALQAVEAVRDAGFRNFSIDVIYGIPGQTRQTWEKTLSKVLSLSPHHVSAYELTPEEHTPLSSLLGAGRVRLPEEEQVLGMYDLAIGRLADKGYEHYEISNFALPGFQCRHNLNYWDRGEYIGIGAGAHSFEGNVRSRNETDIRKYIDIAGRGREPVMESTGLSHADEIKEVFFLGLRKRSGIPMKAIENSGIDFMGSCGELIKEGFLEIGEDRLRLTGKGLLVSNAVFVKLFALLGL